jgi:hypothetical protein
VADLHNEATRHLVQFLDGERGMRAYRGGPIAPRLQGQKIDPLRHAAARR